jgi:hypothetical protein
MKDVMGRFSSLNTTQASLRLTMVAIAISVTGCSSAPGISKPITTPPGTVPPATQHILFVGDSFTHGRYQPVRLLNNTPLTGGLGSTNASAQVVDENFGTTVTARMETTSEYGPYGGIPGIFAELASEASLPYDVHMETISATTLAKHYSVAQSVIAQPLWNAVVLQEASFENLTGSLSFNSASNPSAFCNAVTTIEQGVHAASPTAGVYLYETFAPADTGYLDATKNETVAFSPTTYLTDLDTITTAYHDVFVSAAAQDGHIAGIAPVGAAWSLAWSQNVANPDPYGGAGSGPSLTFDYQAGSQPSTKQSFTDAGYHHPSLYGAYLSGLVLFQKITGTDVRTFGVGEQAAATLGIPPSIAVQLQQIAYQSVTAQNNQLVNLKANLCSLTQ